MKIDVKYVANLARLELTEKQTAKFQKQFSSLLDYIEKLKTLNTKNILPLSHATSLENVFRKDKIKSSLNLEDALTNAPQREGDFFKVPPVIK